MGYEQREGGILFKNDRKKTDKQPDWKGEMTFGGKKYELAAWEKKAKNGSTFLSVSMKEPRPQQQEEAPF